MLISLLFVSTIKQLYVKPSESLPVLGHKTIPLLIREGKRITMKSSLQN